MKIPSQNFKNTQEHKTQHWYIRVNQLLKNLNTSKYFYQQVTTIEFYYT